jgi:hypothetical protein
MFSKVKLFIILAMTVPTLLFGFSPNAQAFNLFGRTCNGNNVQGGNGNNSAVCGSSQGPDAQENGVVKVIRVASNILAFVAGVAAVIVIIISGLTFVLSGGSSDQVASARRRIIYSCVGLIVISLAWIITRFLLNNLT